MRMSEYCRQFREETGLNVLAFSRKLGCAHSYILKIEKGTYDDNPTSLVVAKIILKYNLDIESLANIEGINWSDDYIAEISRHLNKNIGTKMVINKKNIIDKLREEYLFKNGYKDIDEQMMNGNLLINPARFYPTRITGPSYISDKNSISSQQATIYPEVDYTCIKGNKLLFVNIIDITSTIAVNVDKTKVKEYIMKLVADLCFGYFEVKGSNFQYDILLVTPSEKVFAYVKTEILPSLKLTPEYKIGVSLVRPKRPLIEPYFID